MIDQQATDHQSLHNTQPYPCEAKHLQDWVEGLSMSDLNSTSKELYAALKRIDQDTTNTLRQIQSFDILRPAIKQTCSSLAQSLLEQCVQLSQEQIHSSKLAQLLQLSLFNGYKHSLNQFQNIQEKNKNTLIAQAIHRSLSEALDVLVLNYQLYSNIPSELWAEINQLYALAENLDLHNFPVEDKYSKFAKQSTVLQLMIRVQLLVLAQPYGLRRADIALVNQALEHWSRYVYFTQKYKSSALFKVDINQHTAPECCFAESQVTSTRYIDISELVSQLHADLQHTIIIPPEMDLYLLNYLHNRWSKRPKRSSHRDILAGQAEACIGLYATHFYCSQQQQTDLAQQVTNRDYQIHKVRTKDMSVSGFCLVWHEALPPSINVGELISIRFKANQDWIMGVICWVKVHSSTHIEIGVNSYNSEVIAGSVCFDGKTQERAILLPTINYAQPDMLILPRNYLHSGGTINTLFNNKKGIFSLKQTNNCVRGFEQFYLIHANDEK